MRLTLEISFLFFLSLAAKIPSPFRRGWNELLDGLLCPIVPTSRSDAGTPTKSNFIAFACESSCNAFLATGSSLVALNAFLFASPTTSVRAVAGAGRVFSLIIWGRHRWKMQEKEWTEFWCDRRFDHSCCSYRFFAMYSTTSCTGADWWINLLKCEQITRSSPS